VARDSAKPDGGVEIETCADFVEPFEESVLLGCFFFQDSELVVGLGQRLEQLTAQRIRRFAAFDAIDAQARVPFGNRSAVGTKVLNGLIDEPGPRRGRPVQLGY